MQESITVVRQGRENSQLQPLGLDSALVRVISAVRKAITCSLTSSLELCSPLRPVPNPEMTGCLRRKVVTSPCHGTVQCLCRRLRNVNRRANESLLLLPFLHIMPERVIYFLFVKAWLHHSWERNWMYFPLFAGNPPLLCSER